MVGSKKNNKWAVHNIDRFLDGAASFRWQANRSKYEKMIENGDAKDDVWNPVSNDMFLFFSKATHKKEARRKLRGNPSQYGR